MSRDLNIIKKKYGEDMAKLCRELFPTLLETEGLLAKLLLNNFYPNHSLYKDIISQEKEDKFKDYIYSLVDVEDHNKIKTYKTPKELLSEAGYDLYECHSEEEIQNFKKYYSKGEELCTFNGGRLDRCRVFFAVKKDVNRIRREDFENPQRQDKYGTSVISIQFTNDSSHTLSIKNRYNHRVNNPDSTFSNNLDNIIEGLTDSFAKEYGLVQQHKNNGFELEGYVYANDGKYYKYNREINNIYYCPNNIIIDNFEVKSYEKEKYIVMDYFILDLVDKKIKIYDNRNWDSFLDTIKDIEKIELEKEKKVKKITIKVKDGEDIEVVLNENNQIIKIKNINIKKVGDYFLYYNTTLKEVELPNLQEVGDSFLNFNTSLRELNLPNLQKVGNCFLFINDFIQELNLPNLQEVGNAFLVNNNSLQKINFPKLQEVGYSFLFYDAFLKEISLPNLQKVGNDFLANNTFLQEITFKKLQKVGDRFLRANNILQSLTLPNLQEVGDSFLYNNTSLLEINLPNLKKVEDKFLYCNNSLQKINLPNLQKIGNAFLASHSIYNGDKIKAIMWKTNAKQKLVNLRNKIIKSNRKFDEERNKSR